MHVQAVKTHTITLTDQDLYAILDTYLPPVEDNTLLAITSKIVSICQGRVIPVSTMEKQELIEQEADYFLPPSASNYQVWLTIKAQMLIPTAGIDESNGDGYYILWPRDPQQIANDIRAYLQRRFGRTYVGVIITDSKTTPLRWGVTGVALAHSGFHAINDYRGTPDLFGRPLRMTKVNIVDALATAAVLVMGEGNEQTPLALIRDVPFVAFQDRNPTVEELQGLHIELDDDLYAPLLTSVPWQRGKPVGGNVRPTDRGAGSIDER
jgi:putative folate metabolism gamma-glutamate ligase